MHFTLAISPCPNDTFIFDALIHQRIDTLGHTFDLVFADVETLNLDAQQSKYDISKISYHALGFVTKYYQLLSSGSALGSGCGPLLVTMPEHRSKPLKDLKIAIPGFFTTANFLLGMAYPEIKNKSAMVFSAIEHAVLSGSVDAGLLIHENRFTYHQKGLHLIADLGEFWEKLAGTPIPLGGIAVRRSIPRQEKQEIEWLIARSVAYAMEHPGDSISFIREHAQETDAEIIQKHISLYVNAYSINLRQEGKKAVSMMMETAFAKGIIPAIETPLLLNE